MPSGVTVPLTFEVYRGEQLIQTTTLTQDIIKVGKLSSSHLRIDDESISRMHAVIEVTGPGEISIIDLGSARGTVVNGQKVNKHRLQSGDELQLGDLRIVVTAGQPVVAEATQQIDIGQLMSEPTGEPNPPGMSVPASFVVPPPIVAAPFASRGLPAAPPVSYATPLYLGSGEEIEQRDGGRAIEVSAMFEDAVLDVRLLDNPQAGSISVGTKVLVGLGSLSLAAALVMFIVAFVQVGTVRAQRDAWLDAGKSFHDFQAQVKRDSPLTDIGAGAALLFGLAALMTGLLRLFSERGEREYTIGTDPTVSFTMADVLPVARLPLVRSTGSDFEVLFTKQMAGDLRDGDRTQSLSELMQGGGARPVAELAGAYALTLGNQARLNLRLGETTFNIVSTPKARRFPVPIRIDWGAQAYTGAVFALHAVQLLIMFSMPPDMRTLSLDAFMNDQRFAKFLIKPPEEKEIIPEWLKKQKDDDAGGKGKRHKDDEGKMGKKESKNKAGLYALKGPKDNKDLQLAKQLAIDTAQKSGVLGILKGPQGSILASIFGRDSAIGNESADVLGGLVGTEVGEAYGVGGLGLVGSGRGGGGTGEGTIGLGNLGTIGKGGGGGNGSGYGRGAGGLGGRRAGAPEVVPGTAEVRGSLDKEIIRRIIRRHINEVKFCYERELVKNSNLVGRVMIQFMIAANGNVATSAVQASTVNNPPVEQCIAQAVRRWEFPKPQGGGIVMVSYPFVLKAAGGE
jgi:hypothetical protein